MSQELKPQEDLPTAPGSEPETPTAVMSEAQATEAEPTPVADDEHPRTEAIEAPASLEPAIAAGLNDVEAEPSPQSVATSAEPVEAVADPEPEPEPEPEPVTAQDQIVASAAAVAATAGAAAAINPPPSGGQKPPIWSDQGDAPFHDDEDPQRVKKTKSKGGGDNDFYEIIKTIVIALLIATVLRILFFQPFTIPSASMEPNLYEGDYIVVSKWSYGYSKHSIPWSPPLFEGRILESAPKRGDIAVFKLPRDNKTDYIKRVIGLPGDRIQMISGKLHINGQPVEDVVVGQADVEDVFGTRTVTRLQETVPGREKSFAIQDFGQGFPLDSTPVFEVPAGHYFMMGDNRDNSVDSREQSSAGVGLVPAENLVGKAEIILFSWRPGASLWNPVSWFSKVRPSRFFTVLD